MQIIHRIPQLLLIASLILLILGCAPAVKREPARNAEFEATALQQEIKILLESGDYQTAAELLESRARTSESPEKEHLLLQAAEIWSRMAEWGRTEQLLQELSNLSVPEEMNETCACCRLNWQSV